jgi:methionyl aminopeptidase
MIKYKTFEEIELIRDSALIVSKTLALVGKHIKPGVTTLELDKLAEEFIRDHGGEPGFLGYQGFPNSLCTSINEQVVHGIPNNKPLKEGDVVSIDCGVKKNGYYGDHAYTFTVGEVNKRTQKLIDVTKECLYLGIDQAVAGKRIGDISAAVQQHAEKHGFGVVRELVGHGIGQNMHEDPQVPNFGKKGEGPIIKEGMVLAIEPMINMGKARIKQLSDGWTVITQDKKPSAHFEHDIAVRNGKPEILSTFDFIEKDLPFS